jgi:hypothetical protein
MQRALQSLEESCTDGFLDWMQDSSQDELIIALRLALFEALHSQQTIEQLQKELMKMKIMNDRLARQVRNQRTPANATTNEDERLAATRPGSWENCHSPISGNQPTCDAKLAMPQRMASQVTAAGSNRIPNGLGGTAKVISVKGRNFYL